MNKRFLSGIAILAKYLDPEGDSIEICDGEFFAKTGDAALLHDDIHALHKAGWREWKDTWVFSYQT